MNIPFKLLLLTFCQTVVALVFLKGFLLTRIELPDVSQGESPTCSSQLPPYGKAVVLIVDAVRYDFLCGKQGAEGDISGSLMPKTLSLVQAGVSAASCMTGCAANGMCSICNQHVNLQM
jgi:predicted AlkP superfamily pyrophosphatase or phosphodiesterase